MFENGIEGAEVSQFVRQHLFKRVHQRFVQQACDCNLAAVDANSPSFAGVIDTKQLRGGIEMGHSGSLFGRRLGSMPACLSAQSNMP